jgi:hypothetical protein
MSLISEAVLMNSYAKGHIVCSTACNDAAKFGTDYGSQFTTETVSCGLRANTRLLELFLGSDLIRESPRESLC